MKKILLVLICALLSFNSNIFGADDKQGVNVTKDDNKKEVTFKTSTILDKAYERELNVSAQGKITRADVKAGDLASLWDGKFGGSIATYTGVQRKNSAEGHYTPSFDGEAEIKHGGKGKGGKAAIPEEYEWLVDGKYEIVKELEEVDASVDIPLDGGISEIIQKYVEDNVINKINLDEEKFMTDLEKWITDNINSLPDTFKREINWGPDIEVNLVNLKKYLKDNTAKIIANTKEQIKNAEKLLQELVRTQIASVLAAKDLVTPEVQVYGTYEYPKGRFNDGQWKEIFNRSKGVEDFTLKLSFKIPVRIAISLGLEAGTEATFNTSVEITVALGADYVDSSRQNGPVVDLIVHRSLKIGGSVDVEAGVGIIGGFGLGSTVAVPLSKITGYQLKAVEKP